MDVQMPVMAGIEATQHIRSLPQPKGTVPIIALTANVYAEQVAGFLEAGMNDHVGKPMERAELLRVVERWVMSGADETGGSELAAVDRGVYDGVLELIGPSRVQDLLERLKAQLLAFPDTSMANLDRTVLAASAHDLVSTAGMMGFSKLSAVSQELESVCRDGSSVERSLKQFDAARDQVLAEITARTQAA
jgi:DNA-binding response OmpR family regulator